MPTSFPNIFMQIGMLFKNLSPGKKISFLLLIGGVITGFVLLMTWAGKPDFQVLFSNLSQEDAGEIVSRLKDERIPYQIASNGSSILIPGERISEARLELASQGLPQGGGVGFEIFDNTKLGMTEFVQNINYQRALQGELSRTISGLAEVQTSRVHIVMHSKSLFIEEEEPATASVVLKLRSGRRLSKEQIQGIVHLVSSSVSGLSPENVTIVDSSGKMLAGFEDGSTIGQTSSGQLEFQERVEMGLEKRIKTMLEKVLGRGKAIVRLSCSMDFTRVEKTEEAYDPNSQVIRSEQTLHTTSNGPGTNANAAGVAGVPSIDTGTSEAGAETGQPGRSPVFQKQDRTVNYEIGKVISHTVEPVGKITRISVAVVVDGIHKLVKGKKKKERLEYSPRTQDELLKIENIVKSAMNFDAERGDKVEVTNIPFEVTKEMGAEEDIIEEGLLSKLNYKVISKYAFLGVFLLFSFMFVARPLVRWLTSSSFRDAEMLNQLPMTVGEIERQYGKGTEKLPFRDRALEIVAGDAEGSAKLVRDWMKENHA